MLGILVPRFLLPKLYDSNLRYIFNSCFNDLFKYTNRWDHKYFYIVVFWCCFIDFSFNVFQTKFRINFKILRKDVRFLLLKDWFANINWLKLELQFNMFIIQTNRCFIKNRIRDSLCIRRFSIEIFNDYRISLINDFIVIFTIFETKICEIFLITSFDAYIEVCSLKFESRSENRLFVFSLNRCKSFIRFWFASLHYFLSTRSKFHEIYMFDVEINIHVELRSVIFKYHSLDDIFKKFVFESRLENDDEKENMKKKNQMIWRCFI